MMTENAEQVIRRNFFFDDTNPGYIILKCWHCNHSVFYPTVLPYEDYARKAYIHYAKYHAQLSFDFGGVDATPK